MYHFNVLHGNAEKNHLIWKRFQTMTRKVISFTSQSLKLFGQLNSPFKGEFFNTGTCL